MREYLRKQKLVLGLKGREVCIPQSYQLGQEAQVDWYEVLAILGGEPKKLQIFAMRSMGSGGAFHRAYTNATQQAFLEAHEKLLQAGAKIGLCCLSTGFWQVSCAAIASGFQPWV